MRFLSSCVLLSAFLVLTPAGGRAEPRPYVLRTADNVWDVTLEDFDQNGVQDVLVVSCDETSYPLKKTISLFMATAEGAFAEEPTLVHALEASVSTLFLAECNGVVPREIVAVDAVGAKVFEYSATEFALLAEPRFNSLLPSGSKEPMFLKEAAEDFTGDGLEEWLIPVPAGYSLRNMSGEVALLQCDVVSEIRHIESTHISHRLPAYHPFDYDGAKGVAFLSDEFADFTYGKDWTQHSRFRIPRNLEEKWEASSKMDDINNDGFPDLLVTQTKGTINLQVMTQVYIASAPFEYPEVPTITLENKGAIASPGLVDVDGDGLMDLVVINVSFGVKNIVNLFVRGKLTIDAQVYLFKDGKFSDKPAYTTSLTLDAPEGRERVAYALGDFDGDGRKDVAFGETGTSLAIQRGQADRFVESTPWVRVDVPSFGNAEAFKIDGNEAEDIILFHPAGDNSKRVEVILF